eukprot:3784767-Amphidinium_carterae.1
MKATRKSIFHLCSLLKFSWYSVHVASLDASILRVLGIPSCQRSKRRGSPFGCGYLTALGTAKLKSSSLRKLPSPSAVLALAKVVSADCFQGAVSRSLLSGSKQYMGSLDRLRHPAGFCPSMSRF